MKNEFIVYKSGDVATLDLSVMSRLLLYISFVLFCCGCGRLAEKAEIVHDAIELDSESILVQTDTIVFESRLKQVHDYKVYHGEAGKQLLYHDGLGLSIQVFNEEGAFLKEFNCPTINEPYGLNRITDFHVQSADSIFVFDGEFNYVLLLDSDSRVLNHWKLKRKGLRPSISGQIVDVFKEDGDLFFEFTSFTSQEYRSTKKFYEETDLIVKYNLTQKSFETGVGYPKDSPYRKFLFWNGIGPSVTKMPYVGYFVNFPFDQHIYVYDKDYELSYILDTEPKHFPTPQGNPYESRQQDDYVRINVKLNSFNLRLSDLYKMGNEEFIFNIYRKAEGLNDEMPDNFDEYIKGDFPRTYYLQIFKILDDRLIKYGEDILVPEGSAYLLEVNEDNNLVFIGQDYTKEIEILNVFSLNLLSQSAK